jgi:O-antigen/teichoic acid export membrane protein
VGLFGVGYRVASLAGLLMLGFQGALTPLVFTHYRDPETPATLARLFRWFVAFALMVVAGLSLFAPEFLRVFTTPAYVDGARVVPLLAPAVVLSGMYIFAPGLALAKRTGGMALITVAGALLNTGLNFLLVPRLGIVGAAAATFTSALAVFGMYMAASQRLYPVPHRWPRIAAAVLCAAAVMAVAPRLRLDPLAAVAAKAGLLALFAMLLVAARVVQAGEVRRAWHLVRARLSRARPAREAGLP